MAKQTYTIKFGIDSSSFVAELSKLQDQLRNIASSMDVGLSADRVKEFESGLNSILKNFSTAISKDDFFAINSALDEASKQAAQLQKSLGSEVKLDGLINSIGKAKSSLGEFRDMTTTVSGAAVSAANEVAAAQQKAAETSKAAAQSSVSMLDQQRQKLAELQSMQKSLESYYTKSGTLSKKKVTSSLVVNDYNDNDNTSAQENAWFDTADRIKAKLAELNNTAKEQYSSLSDELKSIDWSKAAGDPEELKKTLSLLQQCAEAYKVIHSASIRDELDYYSGTNDTFAGKKITTDEQVFAKNYAPQIDEESEKKAVAALREFSTQYQAAVSKYASSIASAKQMLDNQISAQQEVIKNLESGASAAELQAQADTKAAEAAERKAAAEREASAALSSMAGTSGTVSTESDVASLASARQHTIKIKLSVANQKEFVSQMQSAMAEAQKIADAGIKVSATLSNDMIQTVTKKYSKTGATKQQVVIDVVAQEKDNQVDVVNGIRQKLQAAAIKKPVTIPINVKFDDGTAQQEVKKAEEKVTELSKSASEAAPGNKSKAVIKVKKLVDTSLGGQASEAQKAVADTKAALDTEVAQPVTFKVSFKPSLKTLQQDFTSAVSKIRESASAPIQLDVQSVDLQQITDKSKSLLAGADIKIPVTPDIKQFIGGVDSLRKRASLVTPIQLPVTIDKESLASQVANIGHVAIPVDIEKLTANKSTSVSVNLDPTSAIDGFSSLINAMKSQGNVAITTTLDSTTMYSDFSAVIKKMRDRTTSNPIKVHLAIDQSDVQKLTENSDATNNLKSAYQVHSQAISEMAKAESAALDDVILKADRLNKDISASVQQIPTLIKLLNSYKKAGGNSGVTTFDNAVRTVTNNTQKYQNSSDAVLDKISQYDNYKSSDMQNIVAKIKTLNTELVKTRDNVIAIANNPSAKASDVVKALDQYDVKLADTREQLRGLSRDASNLNRDFISSEKTSNKQVIDIQTSLDQIDKYVNNLPEKKIQAFYEKIADYTKGIRELGTKAMSQISSNPTNLADNQQIYEAFQKQYRVIWSGVRKLSADKQFNFDNPDKAFTKGTVFAEQLKDLDDFKTQVQQKLQEFKEFNGQFVNGDTQWVGTYRDASGAVRNLTLAFDENNKTAREYSSDVKTATSAVQQMGHVAQKAANALVNSIATFLSFRVILGYIQTGIGYVEQLDTALAQLQVVTGQTSDSLSKAEEQARSIANTIGSTTTEVLNSATDWARLGYSMSDSLTLAEKSAELAKTGFMSVATATEQMTAAIQAFYGSQINSGLMSVGDAAEHVNDELVAIGNNMPITSEGLGEALERSAGTLVAAGNSLEQSVALISAANSTIQNPESVGNALKTVSMRLRGTKVSDISNELGEDVSDDFKNAAQNASKLYQTIKQLTSVKANDFQGVSILTDTGSYKSTFEIIKQIAEVWDQMSDVNQAALLENIAG